MSLPFTVQTLDHYEVYGRFASALKRERVAIQREDGKTRYLGAFEGNRLVGVVGWTDMGNGHIRLKTDFVRPEFRRKGIYQMLWAGRMERVEALCPRVLTAFCTSMSLPTYLKAGFERESERNGIAFVRKKFLYETIQTMVGGIPPKVLEANQPG